jgi:general secretion pathway protein J
MECWRNGVLQYSNTPLIQYSKRISGFTLLEILIAIFLSAVVLTTVFTSYTGTFRVLDETESQAEIYRMAGIAMERMLEDLESIYIPKREGNPKSEEDTLSLFQFVGGDREIEIRYYVKESDEGDDLVLYRSDRPMFEEVSPSEDETGGLVLCEKLVSVNFTYYEENGEMRESWDSAADALKGKMPSMVSISLEFLGNVDPETRLKFTTSAALPIERGYAW